MSEEYNGERLLDLGAALAHQRDLGWTLPLEILLKQKAGLHLKNRVDELHSNVLCESVQLARLWSTTSNPFWKRVSVVVADARRGMVAAKGD